MNSRKRLFQCIFVPEEFVRTVLITAKAQFFQTQVVVISLINRALITMIFAVYSEGGLKYDGRAMEAD